MALKGRVLLLLVHSGMLEVRLEESVSPVLYRSFILQPTLLYVVVNYILLWYIVQCINSYILFNVNHTPVVIQYIIKYYIGLILKDKAIQFKERRTS